MYSARHHTRGDTDKETPYGTTRHTANQEHGHKPKKMPPFPYRKSLL